MYVNMIMKIPDTLCIDTNEEEEEADKYFDNIPLKTKKAVKNGECMWVIVGDYTYETSCENIFYFNEGTVSDNEFKFCPFCGKQIKEENNYGKV